ncbi:MAG: 2,3-bisphosphoglycerate-independent phosphoglycerate mutase [SAR202 cluster bacterium]|nr:2,3-bisphosphoglycerate-independent phosphoglycerate mutase [SAR202 cluster bacterium]|tara:strand:- start:32458 stop:33663 length:1206 start_codon:yes stop_codon:yes gene_type:complete
MIDFKYLDKLISPNESKILMLVIDGLGGLPEKNTGKSELEVANIPNLDELAKRSFCGFSRPVFEGITPGSAPGHLGIFGYNPLKYIAGRGLLEASGIGIDLSPTQIAVRGNFCTFENGKVIDRRAGRISNQRCFDLVNKLNQISVVGIKIDVYPVESHRFVVVFDLDPNVIKKISNNYLNEIDCTDVFCSINTSEDQTFANLVNDFVEKSLEILSNEIDANGILLRGFSREVKLPDMGNRYQLNPIGISSYPMYIGLSKLLGMKSVSVGKSLEQLVSAVEENFNNHDFCFMHYKDTDTKGEDGDFEGKVNAIEAFDKFIPRILDLDYDVIVITGDHSTPAILVGHSWHSVPLLIFNKNIGGDQVKCFNEKEFSTGQLGHIDSFKIMMLALANSGKLKKFEF